MSNCKTVDVGESKGCKYFSLSHFEHTVFCCNLVVQNEHTFKISAFCEKIDLVNNRYDLGTLFSDGRIDFIKSKRICL